MHRKNDPKSSSHFGHYFGSLLALFEPNLGSKMSPKIRRPPLVGGHQAARYKLHPASLFLSCIHVVLWSCFHWPLAILDVGWCGQDRPKLPRIGHVTSAWGLSVQGLFLAYFLTLFLAHSKAHIGPQMNPKMTKMRSETLPTKTTYSKTRNFKDLCETMALVFLEINEFLDTVDKLYISSVFAVCRCKPRKTAKHVTNMHPETHQNPTKNILEKTMNLGVDLGMILTSKMTPK